MRKFVGITYPIFGLKKKPFSIRYTVSTISIIKSPDNSIITIDDKRLSGDYYARLFQLSDESKFDYTCRNLAAVIQAKIKWGIDAKAVIHDLSVRAYAPVEIRKVKRIENSLVWLDKISYPFDINTNENYSLDDKFYAKIVKVNNEWFIREFSYDNDLTQPFMLV